MMPVWPVAMNLASWPRFFSPLVISIETTLPHPKRGYVKLEDTVAVTKTGYEPYGDEGRGWNRGKI